jgi:hypothetical protein
LEPEFGPDHALDGAQHFERFINDFRPDSVTRQYGYFEYALHFVTGILHEQRLKSQDINELKTIKSL